MGVVAIAFIALGCAGRVVGMRMRRVVVAVLAVCALAMVVVAGRRLMMAERHALAGDDDRHALEGHDKRDDDGKQADEPQTHGRIVLHAIGRATGRGVPCGKRNTCTR